MLKNLRSLREKTGISQKTLADAIGVSQQSINKYENHNIEPDIDTLIRISDYFGTSVDYLIGHTDIRRKIETVYSFELNQAECDLVTAYRELNSKQRGVVRLLMESYADQKHA